MGFRDLADSRGAVLVQRLGDTATYTRSAGGAVIVDLVFDEGVELVDANGQVVERTRTITVRKSDLLDTVKVGDSVTVLGTQYRVQRVLQDDGVMIQAAVA